MSEKDTRRLVCLGCGADDLDPNLERFHPNGGIWCPERKNWAAVREWAGPDA